ncbi:MAG: SDR family oxidoreductase [Bacteroidota bacterium]
MDKLFQNKVVVISGGTSGLGLATAKLFLEAGAIVIVAARSKERFIANLGEPSAHLTFIETDFNSMKSVKSLYEVIADNYKTIDIGINNVGFMTKASFTEFKEKDFDDAINVNFKSVWLCMQYQIKMMQRDVLSQKYIVNVASSTALGGAEFQSLYSAAKAAVIALTKSVAREFARSNISTNVIVPGPHDTPMVMSAIKNGSTIDSHGTELLKSKILESIPVGRLGQPEEFAKTVLWLCTGENKFISGHTFIMDGGLSSRYR